MVTKLLSILLIFSFVFTQEPCEGTCLSEEETKNLFNNIKELEFDLNKSKEINTNLTLQIVDYQKQIELKDDMIKVVKPKWYDNKYLWFGLGVIFTSGGVYLAGQL